MSSGKAAKPKADERSFWSRTWLPITLFLIAVSGSVAIGFVAAKEGECFNWEVAAVALTGLGTSLLAGATWWLADSTRDSVRDGERELGLMREQVEAAQYLAKAQEKPFVVPAAGEETVVFTLIGGDSSDPVRRTVPIGFESMGADSLFRVRLWNVGHAAAIVVGLWLVTADGAKKQRIDDGAEIVVDAQGRVADESFIVPQPFSIPETGTEAELAVQYRSSSGLGYVTATNVRFNDDGTLRCFGFVQTESEEVAAGAANPVTELPAP